MNKKVPVWFIYVAVLFALLIPNIIIAYGGTIRQLLKTEELRAISARDLSGFTQAFAPIFATPVTNTADSKAVATSVKDLFVFAPASTAVSTPTPILISKVVPTPRKDNSAIQLPPAVLTASSRLSATAQPTRIVAPQNAMPTPVPTVAVKIQPGQEVFVLGEAAYRETESAKNRIMVVPFSGRGTFVQFSTDGRKYFYPTVLNVSNSVLDLKLTIEWKDVSGKTIDAATQHITRLLPKGNYNTGEMYFPNGAASLVFWVDAEVPNATPSDIKVNYVEDASARGKVVFEGYDFTVSGKGTATEQGQVVLRFRNISSDFAVVAVYYRVASFNSSLLGSAAPTTQAFDEQHAVSLDINKDGIGRTENIKLPYNTTAVDIQAKVSEFRINCTSRKESMIYDPAIEFLGAEKTLDATGKKIIIVAHFRRNGDYIRGDFIGLSYTGKNFRNQSSINGHWSKEESLRVTIPADKREFDAKFTVPSNVAILDLSWILQRRLY